MCGRHRAGRHSAERAGLRRCFCADRQLHFPCAHCHVPPFEGWTVPTGSTTDAPDRPLAIYATVALLAMMVIADFLIVSAVFFARDPAIMGYLSGVSGLFAVFVFVIALVGTPLVFSNAKESALTAAEPNEQDRDLMGRLRTLMENTELYADSNLTLARVARRLSVPARDVSGATNRVSGENFSRYINGFRIRHAQRLLCETDLPVTEIMFASGFVSKSSFNTEFRRITGQTPSRFRKRQTDG